MDLSYGEELESYRDEVAKYLSENWPLEGDEAKLDLGEQAIRFRERAIGAGYLCRNIPKQYGGCEQEPDVLKAQIIREEFGKAHAPTEPRGIGTMMLVPTLLERGEEWQKEKFVPPTVRGDLQWCQGYSEPGSGSDLASVQTRGVEDGTDFLITGQKIWTTTAHESDMMFGLIRTEPGASKHGGLSYMLIPMETPGIDSRPLATMTGETEFNEVFFNDVRIPHANMLGKEGQGWRVAITTLMNERVAIGGGGSKRKGGGSISQVTKLWKDRQRGARSPAQEAILRDRVTQTYIEAELLRLTNQRARESQKAGNPGPEGSVSKLFQAESQKRMWETALDVLGADGLEFEAGYELRQSAGTPNTPRALAKYQFLRSRANSIEGGTSEIMRNILGERVLGLPGEARVDKKIAWKDVPRS